MTVFNYTQIHFKALLVTETLLSISGTKTESLI